MPASDIAEREVHGPLRLPRLALGRSARFSLLGVLPLIATGAVYLPLTGGYFVSDDFLNLYSIVNADRLEYLLRPHGGHLLIARNALFVLFHALFGVRAELYFAAVLATHLLNVALLQRALLHWTDSPPLAALGATVWGTCPVQTGALEWYSVYGEVVVATILLVILTATSRVWQRGESPSRAAVVAWPLLFLVASTCFGTGIGLTMVSPVAVFLLLPPSRRRWQIALALLALALVVPFAYRALIVWHDRLAGSVAGVANLAVTWGGLFYRWRILEMFAALLSYGTTMVVLGFAALLIQFPDWASALAVGSFAALVLAAVAVAPARVRRVMFGLLLLTAACYAMIALGRAMYSPSLAEAATRARYHYVATIPLAALLCLAIDQLTVMVPQRVAVHGVLLVAWLGIAVGLYSRAQPFIDLHAAARGETAEVLERIHDAVVSAAPGDEVRIRNRPFHSIGALLFDPRDGFPGWAGVYTIFFPANVVDGRTVRFVVSDPAIVEAAAGGRRTHDLFVLDGAAPSPPPPPISGHF